MGDSRAQLPSKARAVWARGSHPLLAAGPQDEKTVFCGHGGMSSVSFTVAVIRRERCKRLSKQDAFVLEGKVVESLPNAMFKVEVDNGKVILCTISGKIRMNYIRILPGDKVDVQISPYDLTRGRITYRYK